MDGGGYALLDGALSFGVVIGILVWQLVSTEKAKRRRIEREKTRISNDERA